MLLSPPTSALGLGQTWDPGTCNVLQEGAPRSTRSCSHWLQTQLQPQVWWELGALATTLWKPLRWQAGVKQEVCKHH